MPGTMRVESTPPAVRIVEVGPRDGLQNIKQQVPTSTKIDLISRLRAAGLRTIELTSLVSPKQIPQLADARTLLSSNAVRSILGNDRLQLPVLIPNARGLKDAIQHGVKEVAVFVSASEGFSKANTNCSVAEGLERARAVIREAQSAGLRIRGYVSSIFSCPYDGPTPPSAVLRCVEALLDAGCYEVSLGDTIGVGAAADVRSLLEHLFRHGIPADKLAGHFHDTYGQAVSNVWQAYECGIRAFDSSVAGLGGCPYAPGSKGNAATEDLVHLFEQAGVSTGVDLGKLVDTGLWISRQLSKPYDCRAGAAHAAKAQQGQPPTPTKGTLPWQPYRETPGLRVHRAGTNLRITLSRPHNGNALTAAMIADLTSLFHAAAPDPSITRIAITATGRFFCTGMDLAKDSTPVHARTDAARTAQFAALTALFAAVDAAPQVTVACLNGPAFGGGVGLAFACDVRIAARGAACTLSEVRRGLCPATISRYVVREWGAALAREAMLSGRAVSAGELARVGAVAVVVEEVEGLGAALEAYLGRLRSCAPRASALCKVLVRVGVPGGGEQQERGIREAFDEMMREGGEGAFGVGEFQAGRRDVDWDRVALAKSRPHL